MRTLRSACAGLMILLAACSEPPAQRAASAPAPVPEADSSLVNARRPAAPPQGDPASAQVAAPKQPVAPKLTPPARGCALGQDLLLRNGAQRAWAAHGEQALVLLADRRTLERWQLGEPPTLLSALKLGQPVAKLSVLRNGPLAAGFVDDKGEVWLLRGAWVKPERIAQGADRRFAPALAMVAGQLLITFTRTVDEAMHTFVARAGTPELSDLTPAGHGATAASFALGVEPPLLVMLDAHEGISPLLEVPFDARGQAKAAVVRTPVSQPYAPPLLAAVQVPGGELEVAYSALGKLAATAIGRVPLRRAVGPLALHPSRGYGELSFDVALTAKAALFVLEVPVDETPKAAHTIELKWLDAQGEGQTLQLAPAGATGPSIAGSASGGLLVTYVAAGAAHLLRLTCAN